MTISILFSGGLLCLGWEGLGPQEPNGSGNRGQWGSGVTTPTYIHLHPCGGLRVKYCSRWGISQFTGWYMWGCRKNKTAKLIMFDWLVNAHFHFITSFMSSSGDILCTFMCGWQLKDSSRWAHLCGSLSMVLISSSGTWPHRLMLKYSVDFFVVLKTKKTLWFIEINQLLVSCGFLPLFNNSFTPSLARIYIRTSSAASRELVSSSII